MTERKTTAILIKLSEEEKRLLDEAAEREHLPTATWLRALGLNAAKADHRKRKTP